MLIRTGKEMIVEALNPFSNAFVRQMQEQLLDIEVRVAVLGDELGLMKPMSFDGRRLRERILHRNLSVVESAQQQARIGGVSLRDGLIAALGVT